MSSQSAIHFLPPKGHSARALALILLTLIPLTFGALTLFLGQDANWDLRNYHWYNAYAYLNDRAGLDLLPSQTPYFYNPTLDLPFFWLATHMAARYAGFILGTIQGLNFVLLFMLAYASLLIANPRQKVIVCSFLALLGMLGGGGIAMLGTVFYDNVTSLGLFISALLVIRYLNRLLVLPWGKAFALSCLFGIPSGLMMGLKLPSVIFCIGLCFGLLGVPGPFRKRLFLSFAFGIGVLIGVAITLGHWAWFLESHFGNPLFPYFNDYFKSPLAPLTSARDLQFVPRSVKDFLLFPFIFTDSPYRVGEIPWRDLRLVILYVLLPISVFVRVIFGRTKDQRDAIASPEAVRYLLWVVCISYFAWLIIFSIYRYIIPLEMLAPLLIVFSVGLFPLKTQSRVLLAGFILLIIAATVQPGNWYRRASWLDRYVEVQVPPLQDTSKLMILMAGFEPYSHVITGFPHEISFVRIESNFTSPNQDKGMNALLHDRVDHHEGPLKLLIPPWQKGLGIEALGYYNLSLSAKPCQTVIDRLYDDKALDLCEVVRLNHK